MNQQLLKDCSTLGIEPEDIETYQIRDVILKYRKKAREVHPDMFANASEDEKRVKTEQFQELNNAYERTLKHILEIQAGKPDGENDDDDDGERFTKDNFGQFNFPKENSGSFTVIIQHRDADIWQKCLVEEYGLPQISKNDKGTVCDTLWKFTYEEA